MELPEIVAVGVYNSHVAARNTAISKNRKTSLFEIELPLSREGVSYINDSAMPITTDLLICAKPGQVRHTKFPYKCYFVHMMLSEGVLYDTLMGLPYYIKTEKREIYADFFEKIIRCYNAFTAENEILLQSLVLELIYTLSQDAAKAAGKDKVTGAYTPTIEKTLTYIKNHLTEDLRLETVAMSMSVSPIHFHNSFKAAVGKTLHQYVEEQRIKKAINLLMTTDYSLTKIAFECGFSSQSYFSYAFKRKMNKTPRDYVKDIYKEYDL